MANALLALAVGLLLISAVVVLLQLQPQQPGEGGGAVVGSAAPDFELKTLDGSSISLSQFRGSKSVLVNFWATWCPPCKEEMPVFEKLRGQKQQVFEVIGVNLQEDVEAVKPFVQELGVTYPIALDPDSRVKRAYNVIVQPVSVLVSKNGTVLFRRNGVISEEEVFGQLARLIDADAQSLETNYSAGGVLQAQETQQALEPLKTSDEVVQTEGKTRVAWFDPAKIVQVLPQDRIPSIDNPNFAPVSQADFVKDDENVLGVVYNGVAKAYPYSIMVWHEIVNDFFNNTPLLVTYCPLCGTGIVFHRSIGGKAVEFGTSGSLYNSNLLMYDRQTKSLWYQVSAKAVVGEFAGLRLRIIPSDVVKFSDWKKKHPNSLVLTRETGHARDYTRWPYGDYDTNDEIIFDVERLDPRLHPKALVQGVELNGIAKAYPHAEIEKARVVNDDVGGQKILVVFDPVLRFPKLYNRSVGATAPTFKLEGEKLVSLDGSEWDFDGKATSGPNSGSELERVATTTAMWFSWSNLHAQTILFKAG